MGQLNNDFLTTFSADLIFDFPCGKRENHGKYQRKQEEREDSFV